VLCGDRRFDDGDPDAWEAVFVLLQELSQDLANGLRSVVVVSHFPPVIEVVVEPRNPVLHGLVSLERF
jgi:hypothetical protein